MKWAIAFWWRLWAIAIGCCRFVERRSLVWWKCDILGDRFEIEIGGDAINRAILDFP